MPEQAEMRDAKNQSLPDNSGVTELNQLKPKLLVVKEATKFPSVFKLNTKVV